MRLRLCDATFDVRAGWPLVMGVVNANPDSVSDAEPAGDADAQLRRARRLLGSGAEIVDVGGESGRTDVPPVTAAVEQARVLPLISELSRGGAHVSVDTARASVAAAAVEAGACLINDVGGLLDEEMLDIAADTGAGLVVMETRAAPKRESFPGYDDPVAEVLAFLERRMELAVARGVDEEQIVLDPGLDYSKTPAESLELLTRFDELQSLGRPLLLAVSNKYFVGVLTDRLPHERLGGTLAALDAGVRAGAGMVRVHDVREVVDFLSVQRALAGEPARLVDPHDDDRLKWLPA